MRTDKNSGDIVPFQIKIFQLECANGGDIGPQEKRSWPRSDPGAPVCSIQSTVSTLKLRANLSGKIARMFQN